ncbi:MAG: lipid-binding SYLF domain-containing protein [Bryobacteraceae bacterium]
MKRLGVLVAALALSVPAFAATDAANRLDEATSDLQAMANAGDKSVPQSLINKAECIVVVPNLKKGGFIVGGEYGKGFFSCRKTSGIGWSAPGSVRIAGGKFGLLIGGAETDVIMLVMNRNGMEHLLKNKFQIGGEASAAAGPVGRNVSAMTDAEMHAEILTYSRQRGIFGGLDLSGATVTEDKDTNRELYGRAIPNSSLVTGKAGVAVPPAAKQFIHTLNRISSRK